jgi:hypothetical protein
MYIQPELINPNMVTESVQRRLVSPYGVAANPKKCGRCIRANGVSKKEGTHGRALAG